MSWLIDCHNVPGDRMMRDSSSRSTAVILHISPNDGKMHNQASYWKYIVSLFRLFCSGERFKKGQSVQRCFTSWSFQVFANSHFFPFVWGFSLFTETTESLVRLHFQVLMWSGRHHVLMVPDISGSLGPGIDPPTCGWPSLPSTALEIISSSQIKCH